MRSELNVQVPGARRRHAAKVNGWCLDHIGLLTGTSDGVIHAATWPIDKMAIVAKHVDLIPFVPMACGRITT